MTITSHFGNRMSEDAEWSPVNAQVTALGNALAGRNDIRAYVGKYAAADDNGKMIAPAMFLLDTAELMVHTPTCFPGADPADVDLTTRKGQFEYPLGVGAIYHEAMHARYETFEQIEKINASLEPRVYDVFNWLSESRVEFQGFGTMARYKPFLRSMVLQVALKELDTAKTKDISGTRMVGKLACLSLARVESGLLKKKDVRRARKFVNRTFKQDVIQKMKNIWVEFQALSAHETDRMIQLAKDFDKLLQDSAKDNGESENKKGQASPENMPEWLKDLISEMMQEMAKEAHETTVDSEGDLSNQESFEEEEERAAKREEERKETSVHQETAKKIFSNDLYQEMQKQSRYREVTETQIVGVRQPTSEERIAAVRLATALKKAKYSDRIKDEFDTDLPPGRFNARAAMQNAAYRELGIKNIKAPQFRQRVYRHVEDPNLTVAVMRDVSGSMGRSTEPMASTAWVLNEAVHRIQGKFAMVNFGASVVPVVKPGKRMEQVEIWDAPDAYEEFDTGFKALDGALDLLHGRGARLLVVVSDGHFKQHQPKAAAKYIKRCQEAGVAVLWIAHGQMDRTTGRWMAENYLIGTDAKFVIGSTDMAADATAIGREAVAALALAGKRNA